MIVNPYTPGSGFMPAYLAGRENILEEAKGCLERLKGSYPQRSMVYYGLRGVGKTVLLNKVEEYADEFDILYSHIEADERGRFLQKLTSSLNRFSNQLSAKESIKSSVKSFSSTLKSFRLSYNLEENSLGFEMNQDNITNGTLEDDMTDLFVKLGKICANSNQSVCLFIDEVQYLTEDEVESLLSAIHRCNQLRLPILIFCAGLNKILKTMGEAKSYSERLFKFEKIDALSPIDAEAAIRKPAENLGVNYDQGAVNKIYEITNGYPYFVQALCDVVWNSLCLDSGTTIHTEDIMRAKNIFFDELDKGFFSVRYNRCTKLEKDFMFAMLACNTLPCSISNVAKAMNRSPKSISPTRGSLISKGLIHSANRAEIDFTVPQFDGFLKRMQEK